MYNNLNYLLDISFKTLPGKRLDEVRACIMATTLLLTVIRITFLSKSLLPQIRHDNSLWDLLKTTIQFLEAGFKPVKSIINGKISH